MFLQLLTYFFWLNSYEIYTIVYLGALIVINAPWILSVVFGMISIFLDDGQKSKIRIFSNRSEWLPVLRELIEDDHIPCAYGGKGKDFTPHQRIQSFELDNSNVDSDDLVENVLPLALLASPAKGIFSLHALQMGYVLLFGALQEFASSILLFLSFLPMEAALGDTWLRRIGSVLLVILLDIVTAGSCMNPIVVLGLWCQGTFGLLECIIKCLCQLLVTAYIINFMKLLFPESLHLETDGPSLSPVIGIETAVFAELVSGILLMIAIGMMTFFGEWGKP